MENHIITITRQFGSLGRPIAKRMAELLEFEYIDRDILESASAKLNLPVSVVEEREEYAKKKSAFYNMKYPLGNADEKIQSQIFDVQKNFICKLAEKQKSCIVVGRCSDAILQNVPNVLHVYIYSSYAERCRNCVDTLHIEPDKVPQLISDIDTARKEYHMRFAKFMPDDICYKDILINSSVLKIEGTAQLLVQMVKSKFSL